MTELRGLLVAGEVVPGTEWVRRHPRYWFGPGDIGTRARADLMDQLLFHWTAGEAGLYDPDGPGPLTPYDDDGDFVVRVMRGRTRDGRPVHVGIHGVIAACAPNDDEADFWQTADPGEVATVHVGFRPVYRRAVGIEIVSPGTPTRNGKPFNPRNRPLAVRRFAGFTREVLEFFPGQIRTAIRVAEMFANLRTGGIEIVRQVPQELGRRFTPAEAARWTGVLEHHLVPTTKKLDAAGMIIGALAEAGWRVTPP